MPFATLKTRPFGMAAQKTIFLNERILLLKSLMYQKNTKKH